jgi:D-3-phosphoglycerate dehydrogenase
LIELKRMRVLVTPTSFGINDASLRTRLEDEVGEVIYNPFGRPLSAAELAQLLPGCQGYIAGLDAITRLALDHADQLRVIARYGVGVDGVDLEAARAKGIVVTNTPGANSASVAELAVGLMLALVRNLAIAARATQAGEWPRLRGTLLEGKTIGLVGFGAIGKRVARLLQGFVCRVIAHDPYPDLAYASQAGVRLVPLPELLRHSDVISLHCPLLPETRGLVNAAFLAQMKPGAYLVNTARGELVDEPALVEALQRGQLRGAALDVFTRQPPEAGHPLLALPQVIGTPHLGSQTDSATNAMGWDALSDCLAVLRGQEPRYRVV